VSGYGNAIAVFTTAQTEEVYGMWRKFVVPDTMSRRSAVVLQGLNLLIANCPHFMDVILPEYRVSEGTSHSPIEGNSFTVRFNIDPLQAFYDRVVKFALVDHNHVRAVRNAAYRLVHVFLHCLSERLERMIGEQRESADVILRVRLLFDSFFVEYGMSHTAVERDEVMGTHKTACF
jgi:hypothetical protein